MVFIITKDSFKALRALVPSVSTNPGNAGEAFSVAHKGWEFVPCKVYAAPIGKYSLVAYGYREELILANWLVVNGIKAEGQ